MKIGKILDIIYSEAHADVFYTEPQEHLNELRDFCKDVAGFDGWIESCSEGPYFSDGHGTEMEPICFVRFRSMDKLTYMGLRGDFNTRSCQKSYISKKSHKDDEDDGEDDEEQLKVAQARLKAWLAKN